MCFVFKLYTLWKTTVPHTFNLSQLLVTQILQEPLLKWYVKSWTQLSSCGPSDGKLMGRIGKDVQTLI